jgi:hypothetical protein
MSSPDIELLSTRRISVPHSGHFVRYAFDAGVRRYFTVIQDGNFIPGSCGSLANNQRINELYQRAIVSLYQKRCAASEKRG